jgi:hypothetical protein
MSTRPPTPDSEGYTQDMPEGLQIKLTYWNDLANHWVFNDITSAVAQAILQKLLGDPNWNAFTNQMQFVLQRLLAISYKAQVTGTNYDNIYWKVRDKINQELADNLSAIADVSGVWDYSLNLADTGDYFAQLATKASGGIFTSNPINGDVLLLKYITHGNYVKFTVALNTLGQVIAQIIDPVSVFTGPPSFTVTFDTVTRIAIQLPHSYTQGIHLLSASVQNAAADIHPENAEAWMIKAANSLVRSVGGTGIFVPLQRAMDNSQRDLAGSLQGTMDIISQFITKATFNKAKYHVDWGEDPNQGFVVMDFTIAPWRQFKLGIDRIQENFHGVPNSGTVKTWAKVSFEAGSTMQVLGGSGEDLQDCFEGDPPAFRYYPYGIRYVTIHVLIHRSVTPESIHGRVERGNDGSYYVHWENGEIENLGPDFDLNQVPLGARCGDGLCKLVWPPVRTGTARKFDLHVDYATQSISGLIDQTQVSGINGQQIHIPGNASKPEIWPDVWLTISMEGTRTPMLP